MVHGGARPVFRAELRTAADPGEEVEPGPIRTLQTGFPVDPDGDQRPAAGHRDERVLLSAAAARSAGTRPRRSEHPDLLHPDGWNRGRYALPGARGPDCSVQQRAIAIRAGYRGDDPALGRAFSVGGTRNSE